jgi:hypothetical protein
MISGLAYGDFDAAMMALERGVEAREPLFGHSAFRAILSSIRSNPSRVFSVVMKRLGARACPAIGKWPIERGHR